MNRPAKYITDRITPEELEEVFGWALAHEEAILMERIAPKEQIGDSRLIVPDHVRRDRQTGSTGGSIIQIGRIAEEELNKRLERSGKKVEIGGVVSFAYAAPVDLGLLDDTGHPMMAGISKSPYAAICLINYVDVLGYYSKSRFKL